MSTVGRAAGRGGSNLRYRGPCTDPGNPLAELESTWVWRLRLAAAVANFSARACAVLVRCHHASRCWLPSPLSVRPPLPPPPAARYIAVTEAAKGTGCYDDLVKYLLMVRKKVKEAKVRGRWGQGGGARQTGRG